MCRYVHGRPHRQYQDPFFRSPLSPPSSLVDSLSTALERQLFVGVGIVRFHLHNGTTFCSRQQLQRCSVPDWVVRTATCLTVSVPPALAMASTDGSDVDHCEQLCTRQKSLGTLSMVSRVLPLIPVFHAGSPGRRRVARSWLQGARNQDPQRLPLGRVRLSVLDPRQKDFVASLKTLIRPIAMRNGADAVAPCAFPVRLQFF